MEALGAAVHPLSCGSEGRTGSGCGDCSRHSASRRHIYRKPPLQRRRRARQRHTIHTHCGHAHLVERRARTMDAAAGAEGRGRRARRALEPHPRCVCRVVPRGELSRLHDAWAARRDVLHHARGGRQPAHERRTAPSRTTGVGTAPSLGGQLPTRDLSAFPRFGTDSTIMDYAIRVQCKYHCTDTDRNSYPPAPGRSPVRVLVRYNCSCWDAVQAAGCTGCRW